MRNVIMLNRISIDGYFASLNEATGGMDWFVQDPKVDQAVHEPVTSNTLILGEKTFLLFERSWLPMLHNPQAPAPLQAIAEELTNMRKIVFSHRLKASEWQNTEFVSSDPVEVVQGLKQEPGTDILIMGSGTIVQQLTEASLIDKYLFIVTPVIAGRGKPLFPQVAQQNLKLVKATSFDSGNMVLQYETTK